MFVFKLWHLKYIDSSSTTSQSTLPTIVQASQVGLYGNIESESLMYVVSDNLFSWNIITKPFSAMNTRQSSILIEQYNIMPVLYRGD